MRFLFEPKGISVRIPAGVLLLLSAIVWTPGLYADGIIQKDGAISAQQQVTLEACAVDSDTKLPVPAARISGLTSALGSVLFSADLGPTGCTTLHISPGKITLRFDADGYFVRNQELETRPASEKVMQKAELFRCRILRGIVRNAKGEAVPGAYIQLFQKSVAPAGPSTPYFARSGDGGKYEARIQAKPIEAVYAFKPAQPLTEINQPELPVTGDAYLEIALPEDRPVIKLTGKVLDDAGKPVRFARVSITAASPYHASIPEHDRAINNRIPFAISDLQGNYVLETWPQATATLSIRADDMLPLTMTTPALTDTEKNIQLKRAQVFHVTVLDAEGHDVPNMRIYGETRSGGYAVYPASTTYPPMGQRYYATEYPLKIYGVGIGIDQAIWWNLGITPKMTIGKYQAEIVLTLGRGEIDGQVTDASGQPVKNFMVILNTIDDQIYRHPRAPYTQFFPEDGSFTLRNIPSGKASITIRAAPAQFDEFTRDILIEDSHPVTVKAVLLKKASGQAEPSFQGSPAGGACPVSNEPTYGYSKDEPIKVGGGLSGGVAREYQYLRALRSPEGRPVQVGNGIGALLAADGVTFLDSFQINYAGLDKPIFLYIDMYHWVDPKAPKGFVCGTPFGLNPPGPDAFETMANVRTLAIEQGAARDFAPIPLDTDSATIHGVAYDYFRILARASRAATQAGKPINPQKPPQPLTLNQTVVIAYPLKCDERSVSPTAIDIIGMNGSRETPLVRARNYTMDTIAELLPGVQPPPGSLATVFSIMTLRPNDVVRITYADAVCAGDSKQASLPIKMTPGKTIRTMPAVMPEDVPLPPEMPTVHVQVLVDFDGVPRYPAYIDGQYNLAGAAIAAVRLWVLEPPQINGAPVLVPLPAAVPFIKRR